MSEEENKEEESAEEKASEEAKPAEPENQAEESSEGGEGEVASEQESVEQEEEKPAAEEAKEDEPEQESTEKKEKSETEPQSEEGKSAEKSAEDERSTEGQSKSEESSKGEGEKDDDGDKSEKKEETAADLLGANIEQVKVRKAKGSKNISSGICFIVATFNNTKVSFSDMKGNVISWSSSGKCNFRGSRKSTAYAAQVVTQDAGRVAMSHGMKEVLVKVKGPGMGRDSAIRALQSLGFSVTSIIDVTPVPHNGCRPPKRRRV
ncbi:MAG TPA: 30S ribosomal protein S11 [Opitutae bacterium]|nr:30S ribosomal protein S11 [Opitutae bacterium]|tara:strand:+ start:346 stop:1134 length:789 start_codon:yes stop_codon:yes gene_type:complete